MAMEAGSVYWCHEYLTQLQQRPKGNNKTRNFTVGDIVLDVDDSAPMNTWMLARDIDTFPYKKCLV